MKNKFALSMMINNIHTIILLSPNVLTYYMYHKFIDCNKNYTKESDINTLKDNVNKCRFRR